MRSTPIILLLLLLSAISLFATQGINYQAVARDMSGQPLSNAPVGLKFTIHTGSLTGPIAYQESHVVHSNQFGIITVIIGGGGIMQGNIDSVNWASETYLQVEYDATGGTSYNDMGTTRMTGAAFSSYANTANNAINATHSLSADNALRADTALMANNAATAVTATSADHALNADNAVNAITADNATHSLNADNAISAATATNAVNANHALNADNATNATTAGHATTSDVALNATNSTNAANAVNASHSLLADNASHADTAVTATHSLTADVAATALTTSGISVYYAESLAQSSTTSASFQDKATLTLQPGTYLLTFSAMFSSNNHAGLLYNFDCGTTSFSGTPVVTDQATEFLSVSNTIRVTYATSTTVKIQYSKNGGGGNTAYTKNATISAISTN